MSPSPPNEGPLAGVRIVEAGSYVAVPLAGMQLAQLGADVIRVDRPGGGPDYRRWPLAESGTSIYWTSLNKGKRSVELDLRTPHGQESLGRLVASGGASGGIFITNAQASAGTHDEELRRYRPDLILVRLSGRTGGSPAVDYTVGAASGIPLITGATDQVGPLNQALPAYDLVTGMTIAVALLTALRHRDRTGEGQAIDISLEDVALAMVSHLGYYAEAERGTPRQRHGNYVYGTYGVDFDTASGERVMVVALTDGQWNDLITRTDSRALISEVEDTLRTNFSAEAQRYEHRVAITAALQPWFRARTIDAIAAAFDRASFPWSPFYSMTDVAIGQREQLLARPMFDEIDQPGVGTVVAARFAATMSATPPPPPVPAPALGADTAELLAEIDDRRTDGSPGAN